MKKLLKVFIGLFLTLVVLALVVPFFVPVEKYKEIILAEVKAKTGRDLKVGSINISLLPTAKLSLKEVSFSNPSWSQNENMINAGQIKVGVDLKALTKGNVVINDVDASDIELNLEKGAGDTVNWKFKEADKESGLKDEAGDKFDPKTIQFGDIKLSNVNIKLYEAKKAAPFEILLTDAKISAKDITSPLVVKADGSLKNQKIDFYLKLSSIKDALDGKSAQLYTKANTDLFGFEYNSMLEYKGGFNTKGDLKANINLDGLNPASKYKKLSIEGKFNSEFSDTEKSVKLNNGIVNADGLNANVNIYGNLSGKIPYIKGNINIPEINLNDKNGKSSGESSDIANNGFVWSTEKINLDFLKAFNADLNITVGKFIINNITTPLNILAKVNDSVLSLDIQKTSLFEGIVEGGVTFKPTNEGIYFSNKTDISGLNINLLLDSFGQKTQYLGGNLNLNYNARGVGDSQYAIIQSLIGSGSLNIGNCVIKGYNLLDIIKDLPASIQNSIYNPDKRTTFPIALADFNIVNGKIVNKNLNLASDSIKIIGEGQIDLYDLSINYFLLPEIKKSDELKGLGATISGKKVPLRVSGTVFKPIINPDVSSIIEGALRDPEEAKKTIKELKNNFKDIIGAFKGRKKNKEAEAQQQQIENPVQPEQKPAEPQPVIQEVQVPVVTSPEPPVAPASAPAPAPAPASPDPVTQEIQQPTQQPSSQEIPQLQQPVMRPQEEIPPSTPPPAEQPLQQTQ